MDPIRILHTFEPGHGWYFTSPDIPGLTGSDETYRKAHGRAEEVVRWHLETEAAERGGLAPTDLEFVHFVPDTAAPSLAA